MQDIPTSAVPLDAGSFWDRLLVALETVDPERRTPPAGARSGAVLVLLEDGPRGPRVILTRRRRDLRSHPGQLSFPGGRLDPGETVEEAALREAAEEVGLDPASVEVVGGGPVFYVPPSRFWVAPVLARWAVPHELRENPWEVDSILHVDVADLLDPQRWRHVPLSLQGSSWAWQLEDDLLWGATAAVLAVLLDTGVPGWSGGCAPERLGPERAVRPWELVPLTQRRQRLVGELPACAQESLPHVTAAQVRAVRDWLDRHGLDEAARAEQAGRAVCHAVRRLSGGSLDGVHVTVLAGPSSNGAGGLAAARLLAAAGAEVAVLLAGRPRLRRQVELLRASGVEVARVDRGALDRDATGTVVVDALLGIGTAPPLGGLPKAAARWLRRHDVPVVALELPSGLDPDRGLKGPCITADVTVALGLPLQALAERVVHAFLGDLYLADLGVPPAAWAACGVTLGPRSPFGEGPLVRLEGGAVGTDAATPDQAGPTR